MNQDYNVLLKNALDIIVSPKERERVGIGMQTEKTLHAVLKRMLDENISHHEQPVGPFIADILDREHITEIQTANMGYLREKLEYFFSSGYTVTVVYPIPHRKHITWIDPETGELGKRNSSTRTGTFFHAFRELYKIRRFLKEERLTVELFLIDMEEYRLQDGWGHDGKRGSHRFDRIPTQIYDHLLLQSPEDYHKLLTPVITDELPEVFTSAQLQKSCHYVGPAFSHVPLLLTEMNVLERCGKQGRAYLYRIKE